MDVLLLGLLGITVVFSFIAILIGAILFEDGKWVTLYECQCGNKIENGIGKWDSRFFLDDCCNECGRDKGSFKRLGKFQIKQKSIFSKKKYEPFSEKHIY